jgi:HK97 family phage portal protein
MANILSRLRSTFPTIFGGGRVPRTGPWTRLFPTSAHEVYHDFNGETSISKGFNRNTAIYSIVMKDAEKFAAVPRYVYKKQTNAEASPELLNSPLQLLLDRPNDYEGQDAFLTKVRAMYKASGEVFIWLNRGDAAMGVDEQGELYERTPENYKRQPILEMYVLPTHLMVVVGDPENLWGVDHYILDIGNRIRIRKEDILHWKAVNLDFDAVERRHLRGHSPLTSGYKSVELNNSSVNSSVRGMQNDGSKGVLYNKVLGQMTPEQQSRVRGVIDAKINDADLKSTVAALEGEWGYHSLGLSGRDMETLEVVKFSWQELCFLLGVPYELFDGKTAFNNKKEAKTEWVSDEIIPACKQFDQELARALLPAFNLEGKAFIASDFDQLPELQEDLAKKAEWLMKVWPLTPNQVLDALGYPQRSEKQFNEPYIPMGVTPLSEVGQEDELINEIEQARNANGVTNTGNGNG